MCIFIFILQTLSILLTWSSLLTFEHVSKAEENALALAHSPPVPPPLIAVDGVAPAGVVDPRGSPSDIEPFI